MNATFAKVVCQQCSQPIEYPADIAEREIKCPECGSAVPLQPLRSQPAERGFSTRSSAITPRVWILAAVALVLIAGWMFFRHRVNQIIREAPNYAGPQWHYQVDDVLITNPRTAKLSVRQRYEFQNGLNAQGKYGGELVAVIPLAGDLSAGRGMRYRFIFKKPGRGYDMEVSRQEMDEAIKEESAADEAAFQKELEQIRSGRK